VNFTAYIPFIAALAGTIVFWAISRVFLSKINFDLGRGDYVGGWPQLGAFLGIIFSTQFVSDSPFLLNVALALVLLTILGLIKDREGISNNNFMLLLILSVPTTLYFSGITSIHTFLMLAAWVGLIFVCLKISALVYEMPFILTATSSLTILVFFSHHDHSAESLLMTWAILACSLIFLLYSATGRRALNGNAGLATTSVLLGLVSFMENSGKLILFGLLIPSMVILFPFALISFLIIASYFGNRLHATEKRQRNYHWTLEREKLVVFSGLIFLCLNFLGILVEVKAPVFGYFAIFFLLIAAMYGFFRTFARKIVEDTAKTDKVQILGTEIAAVTPANTIEKIADFLESKQNQGLFHVITADSLALLRSLEDERFNSVMNRAELVIPDGAGIVWAADFLGNPLPARVPGVALVGQVCEICVEKGFKVFFLGGKPGIADKAVKKLSQEFPGMKIVGVEHGYFRAETSEEDIVIDKIVSSAAEVVFVALGVPRQEWFISRLRRSAKKSVAIGVGGSFDVISETLPRAPIWMQRFGIEWLFRLWLEPFRIGRIAKIPAFVLQVLRYKWNSHSRGDSCRGDS
jgi:N-acetylglucosaminyldiphosphoundecaprenol N-acetyl-beta-D-mannosaminyltransferase